MQNVVRPEILMGPSNELPVTPAGLFPALASKRESSLDGGPSQLHGYNRTVAPILRFCTSSVGCHVYRLPPGFESALYRIAVGQTRYESDHSML